MDNLNKIYDHGYQAFFSGVDFTKNPYKKDSPQGEEWSAGWEDAANEDLATLDEENFSRGEKNEFD